MAKTGVFPGGSKAGAVIYMGFPFETIYDKSQQIAIAGGILEYFELTATGIETIETILQKKIIIKEHPPRPGDQSRTKANINKARSILGYDHLRGEIKACC